MSKPVNKPPPASTDLEGWKQAIADDSFRGFKHEALVAALQDLGEGAGDVVRNKLALHLSREIMRILRKCVGVNHVNGGMEIVEETHGKLVFALIQPETADGKALREAFVPRAKHRMFDAIRSETKHEARKQKLKGKVAADRSTGLSKRAKDALLIEHEASVVNVDYDDEGAKNAEERRESDEAFAKLDWHKSSEDPREAILEEIDLNRALEKIDDPRKRLAVRLYMEQVPYDSKKDGVLSIAKVCKVSEKTVRDWIDEVRDVVAVTVGGRK